MAATGTLWERLQDEVRTVSDRARRSTRRAVQTGVLQVDLVSLRRDRSRTLAKLGERAHVLWSEGSLATLEHDAEALRFRHLLEGIERCIEAKEAELAQWRREADEAGAARASTASSASESSASD